MLDQLKEEVLRANIELQERNLVIYTWGNVSGINQERDLVVIKPSGIPYHELSVEKMVVIDLEGQLIEGDLNPSSDVLTHLELYRHFSKISSVAHTHSMWATVWAQSKKSIPCFGSTHADHFYHTIPCTRSLTTEEINKDYELNTGHVIIETFKDINYLYMPGVLVSGHGPFTWGKDPGDAVYHSVVLEEVAKMAFFTMQLKGNDIDISKELLEKHFWRKHGKNAYYGQKRSQSPSQENK